jgi:hypothetical protein
VEAASRRFSLQTSGETPLPLCLFPAQSGRHQQPGDAVRVGRICELSARL